MNKTEDLLALFENYTVSQNMRENLAIMAQESWFNGIFTGWVHRRLREGIGQLELLTLTHHFDADRNPELGSLGHIINSVIIGNVIMRGTSHDYFLYMIKYDRRKKNNLLKDSLKHITHMRIGDAIPLLRQMAEALGRTFEEMVLDYLEEKTEYRSLSNMMSLESLEFHERLKVIALSCKCNRRIFDDLALALDNNNLLEYAIDRANSLQGFDELTHALFVTEIPIERLEKSKQLIAFLIQSPSAHTIQHLLKRAEFEQRWNFVLKLAPAYNKKEILRILLKAKDPILIDKFFFLYKTYPEVKNLTPFL